MVDEGRREAVELAVLSFWVEELDDLFAEVFCLLVGCYFLSELTVDLADLALYLTQDALARDLLLKGQTRVLVELCDEPLEVQCKVYDFPQGGLSFLSILASLAFLVHRNQHCQ